ncbi:EAL domain-containing protein [Pengzhenrongella sicca]|uniref:Bifunctional diguanylate cyclase/phosphodiesterase n=1 Tax=Pengzhenrongella sicca TaxID=2819238 RepID=A0A8A4ZB18_9MICO|nr:bifunctional diguanylate cyclase/phosphodiesterase [Pengzhenrongella sicca]QTE27776.1 bifunctional diguanylate cyclase/phosphodiesterase [Pengzhenrongella sicca]
MPNRPVGARGASVTARHPRLRLFAPVVLVLMIAPVVLVLTQSLVLRRALDLPDYSTFVVASAWGIVLTVVLALPVLYFGGGHALARRLSFVEARAFRDELTGLPNEATFREVIEREIDRAMRYRDPFTLALVDVDDFTFVRANVGGRTADDLLVALAHALRTGRSVDLPFYLGGDTFAVIMPHTDGGAAAWAVTRLRHAALARMGGITVSAGLAVFDPAALSSGAAPDGAVLRARAGAALDEAKRNGRNQVVTHSGLIERVERAPAPDTIAAVQQILVSRFMSAEYQPIWNVETQVVLGIEGFARPAAELGLSGPREAFDAADQLGCVDDLDLLCRQAVLAHVADLPTDLLLFLNVAPEFLEHGEQAGLALRDDVEAAGLSPGHVVVELAGLDRAGGAAVTAASDSLRGLGFRLALNDPLSHADEPSLLRRVRPDYVKVSRDAVRRASDGHAGRAALASVLAFCADAHAALVAEGIETESLLHHLVTTAHSQTRHAQVICAQGYLLGRPAAEPPWRRPGGMAWPLEHAA